MKSGLPPSSHAFVRGTAALDIERGNLRESMAGLRNLAQLLHSLRVGTRPLSSVLPAARDACDPLRHAMGEILAAARSELRDSDAADRLHEYVTPRLQELETALDINNRHFPALKNLAVLYQKAGFRNKAIETWERALHVAPDDATRQTIKEHLLGLL